MSEPAAAPVGAAPTLVLGIGNLLLGDEGVGVHVIRWLGEQAPLPGAVLLDGGTGGFHLLGAMQEARRIVLVDATDDGQPPGTISRLTPRYSADYPRGLSAHDIGLKDLLDAFHLLGDAPQVTLFTVSIDLPCGLGLELSPAVAAAVPEVAGRVRAELARSASGEPAPSAAALTAC